MQSKNHNNPQGVLPNFCHLGTSLRAILAVEAASLFSAWSAAPDMQESIALFTARSVLIQPLVLMAVIGLCLASPLLKRLSYPAGMAVLFAIGVTIPWLGSQLLLSLLPDGGLVAPFQVGLFSSVLSALLLGYFHLRGKALSPAVTEARLQALQARIRPHFLFNSLNAVLSLVRSNPRQAEQALEDLSELFRALMRENRDLMPLRDEIELTRAYLGLEQLRLGDRLTVVWHIDKMPGEALIPPLIIQPLAENAIYHGIEPRSEPGEININVYRSGDMVHIVIQNSLSNTGSTHSGNKLAMANIQERLALHFDLDATLKSERLGAVYQVHISLPYSRATHSTPPVAGR